MIERILSSLEAIGWNTANKRRLEAEAQKYSGLFDRPTVSEVVIRHPAGESVTFLDPSEDDPAFVFEREIDDGLMIVTIRRA
jgi:hypothetical protein